MPYPEKAESITVEKISLPHLDLAGVSLSVLRARTSNPFISGNKAWKLKYNIAEAKRRNSRCLVTFGGAFSNHLLAVAAAANHDFSSVGIVRGEEKPMNPVLKQCENLGMNLIYVSRHEYRDKEKLVQKLRLVVPSNYILPEGGSNALAVQGCAEIVPEHISFDHLFVAVGTGGTLGGIAMGAKIKMPGALVHGVVVLKGGEYLSGVIEKLAPGLHNWKLNHEFHGGGYAKAAPELLEFNERFFSTTGIPVEPIYSGKMFFAICEMARQGRFDRGTSILAVHTGGVI